MKREVAVFIFVVLLMPFLAGCWSRNEIENIAIIGGIGIDKVMENGREQFQLTANILRPSLAGGGIEGGGGGAGRPIYWRISATGSSLADCERALNLRIARVVFYGHTRYIVIGERVAREDMADAFDYVGRHPDMRLRILVLLAAGNVADVMNAFSELENTIAKQVTGMESVASLRSSETEIRNLAQITDDLTSPGIDPVIAKVSTMVSPPTEPGGKPVKVLRYEGGGAIRSGKLAGWLNEYETRGYLLAVGRATKAALAVSLENRPMPDTTIALTRVSTKTRVEIKEGRVVTTIEIRAEGDLGEYHGEEEIATHEGLIKLEEAFAKEIDKEVRAAVTKAKKINADIFGFGAQLYRSNPQAWKKIEQEWYKIFPTVEVKTKITVNVRRTGFIANPFIFK